jgi:hypothetical protein
MVFVLCPCDRGCKFRKRYISQNNFLNVFKLAGYVILSTVNMKNFKSHSWVGVYATCRGQKLMNLAVGTQFLTFATNNENGINKHSQMIFIHVHKISK